MYIALVEIKLSGALHTRPVCMPYNGPVSEALPEDYLRPVLFVLLPTDPSRAEGGQLG